MLNTERGGRQKGTFALHLRRQPRRFPKFLQQAERLPYKDCFRLGEREPRILGLVPQTQEIFAAAKLKDFSHEGQQNTKGLRGVVAAVSAAKITKLFHCGRRGRRYRRIQLYEADRWMSLRWDA